jgi:peroxiredoxin
VIGLSVDPPGRNLAWTKQLGLPFRLLSDNDPPGRVARLYGVWDETWGLARRVTFVVDRSRTVRFVEAGSLAVETTGTLDALGSLARPR